MTEKEMLYSINFLYECKKKDESTEIVYNNLIREYRRMCDSLLLWFCLCLMCMFFILFTL